MLAIFSRLDSTPTTILILVYSLIIILGFISNMGIGFAFATDKVTAPNLLYTWDGLCSDSKSI